MAAAGTTDTTAAPRTRTAARRSEENNVNDVERVASVAAGGALAAYALKQRGLPGLLAGVVGGLLVQRGVTGHCRVYEAVGTSSVSDKDGLVKQHGASAVLDASSAHRVERVVTIQGKTPEELYAFWRNFENLPRIMEHLESVEVLDDRRSRWTAKAPAGRTVRWEAEIHHEIPGELIAWRSLPDADVKNAGSVHFQAAPGGRGTEVRVVLEYEPPAGKIGAVIAKLFGEEPDTQVREDLRRFKMLMETGELAVSEIPGQGAPARQATFNAQANNDADVRATAPERDAPHEPQHVPAPADVQRGTTSTAEHGEATL